MTFLLLIWEVLTFSKVGPNRITPSPFSVFKSALQMARDGTLALDFGWTLFRVLSGFAIGSWLGTMVGIKTGINRWASNFVEPVIQIFRPIPAIALIPLTIVWFGVGEISKLFIVGWACFFPVWINTHSGVRRVSKEIIWTALTLGATQKRVNREVIVPWATPAIVDGIRIGLGLCFAATVVAEMAGASAGLGYRIIEAQLVFRYDRMIASILILGLFGFIADRTFRIVVRWRISWMEFKESV